MAEGQIQTSSGRVYIEVSGCERNPEKLLEVSETIFRQGLVAEANVVLDTTTLCVKLFPGLNVEQVKAHVNQLCTFLFQN